MYKLALTSALALLAGASAETCREMHVRGTAGLVCFPEGHVCEDFHGDGRGVARVNDCFRGSSRMCNPTKAMWPSCAGGSFEPLEAREAADVLHDEAPRSERVPGLRAEEPAGRRDMRGMLSGRSVQSSWEELVGSRYSEARAQILGERPDLEVVRVVEGAFVTMDFKPNRVRVWVSASDGDTVVKKPRVG